MMMVNEIKLFELLKAKIGEKEAEAFVQIIETRVDSKFEEAKQHLVTKEDLLSETGKLHLDIEKIKGELLLIKWMMGFILAGILSLLIKSFF